MTTHKPINPPSPLAICLEDLGSEVLSRRFLSCVAMVGSEPGLTLDGFGRVRWRTEAGARGELELWVSGDGCLMLMRQRGGPKVRVTRGGRHLDAPEEKPVVLLSGDVLSLKEKELKVHVHGTVDDGYEPMWFDPTAEAAVEHSQGTTTGKASAFSSSAVDENEGEDESIRPGSTVPGRRGRRVLRATAAALALGTAMGAAACNRDGKTSNPKSVSGEKGSKAAQEADAGPPGHTRQWMDQPSFDGGLTGPEGEPPGKKSTEPRKPPPPIDVRVHPPKVAPPTRKP